MSIAEQYIDAVNQADIERLMSLFAPTATLSELEIHVTTLNPGIASHPPHRDPVAEGLTAFLAQPVSQARPGAHRARVDVHEGGAGRRVVADAAGLAALVARALPAVYAAIETASAAGRTSSIGAPGGSSDDRARRVLLRPHAGLRLPRPQPRAAVRGEGGRHRGHGQAQGHGHGRQRRHRGIRRRLRRPRRRGRTA